MLAIYGGNDNVFVETKLTPEELLTLIRTHVPFTNINIKPKSTSGSVLYPESNSNKLDNKNYSEEVLETRKTYPNHHKLWTKEDERDLLKLYKTHTLDCLCNHFGRKQEGITSRINKLLGVRFLPNNVLPKDGKTTVEDADLLADVSEQESLPAQPTPGSNVDKAILDLLCGNVSKVDQQTEAKPLVPELKETEVVLQKLLTNYHYQDIISNPDHYAEVDPKFAEYLRGLAGKDTEKGEQGKNFLLVPVKQEEKVNVEEEKPKN
ncbi:Hypothetical protein ORPV_625 [Orpheovirus IHUMI-LCC2]|uniref:Uncharacterized protein n=1 Tax=Orpheovirus IHUMI-LCC2 TaxID=2023057 RepID=A0A2I2L4Z4_9VIRU|nr:Hypothetical protein ORPV_625 [Orpheovirus IHUMI-LCC2]SNW62529.1 Hypothetical protein ORPV_625 [Orpheovirus IHUMI-LCC2]